jgi:transposase
MIPATVRIFVFTEPVDMRRGFDSLALIARDRMAQDPRSGALLIFSNRHANRIKALWWDTTGYCLLYKRAHKAVFELPAGIDLATKSVRIDGKQLAQLLAGTPKVRKSRPKLRVVR